MFSRHGYSNTSRLAARLASYYKGVCMCELARNASQGIDKLAGYWGGEVNVGYKSEMWGKITKSNSTNTD